ncbi:MerR family transcriptional regulator [Methylobacterium hispanicum]|jgi:MerR family mercuric resistance operon transcriptional regulator|uniref:Mercuric resistance operon regulatory protein n=2 Tax=Methylobacteriaceae TaxID=119045 RepID=A0AAV4ZIN1_9HYPH|nr:Mercuric resistance operon regulatory protein [Methylobacterium hispanicum]
MSGMTIAALAREGGVGVETVRYYQRRGLLETPERGGGPGLGGIRRYGGNDARRLRFIRSAQAAGFTLEQIAELIELDATDDRSRARDLARERLAALDARIADLQAARSALARLERACDTGAAGPCPIIEAFEQP